MKHIGILAHSAEGASLCFLSAVHEGSRQLGEHLHPDITLDCMPFGPTMPHWEKLEFETIRKYLLKSAGKLARAGCDFFVLPDNTGHLALEASGEPFPIPALHIADAVADEAAAKGFKRVAVLGTKWTMTGPIYKNALAKKGIESAIPGENDVAFINRTIFDELCSGIFKAETTAEYIRIIDDLKASGCDAAALVCTEIPIIITPENSPLPTLDSTRLLGKAAVNAALGKIPMPDWRGGRVYTD